MIGHLDREISYESDQPEFFFDEDLDEYSFSCTKDFSVNTSEPWESIFYGDTNGEWDLVRSYYCRNE